MEYSEWKEQMLAVSNPQMCIYHHEYCENPKPCKPGTTKTDGYCEACYGSDMECLDCGEYPCQCADVDGQIKSEKEGAI
jgi:hypothetical protein